MFVYFVFILLSFYFYFAPLFFHSMRVLINKCLCNHFSYYMEHSYTANGFYSVWYQHWWGRSRKPAQWKISGCSWILHKIGVCTYRRGATVIPKWTQLPSVCFHRPQNLFEYSHLQIAPGNSSTDKCLKDFPPSLPPALWSCSLTCCAIFTGVQKQRRCLRWRSQVPPSCENTVTQRRK